MLPSECKKCPYCKKEFVMTLVRCNRKYCSKECYLKNDRERQLKKKLKAECQVASCDNIFETASKRQKYCSYKCKLISQETAKPCIVCKNWYIIERATTPFKYCSGACYSSRNKHAHKSICTMAIWSKNRLPM
jgi:hypothetical protein